MWCAVSGLSDTCRQHWPAYTLAGGVACLSLGHYVIKRRTRRQIQEKIRNRGQRAERYIQEVKEQLSKDHVDAKIASLSFEELRTQLQEGKLKAEDTWKSFMSKALEVHGRTNAVTDIIPSSKAEAQALDQLGAEERGLLHGLPISLKEAVGIKGMDCTAGFAELIDKVRIEDSILVQVLKSQGAVPFVKTNLSQGLMSIASENPVFGLTCNSMNEKRSCGGSSGGEGALIGGGGSVVGVGSDIGGSIRIPAAFCGTAALKPTNGRYSFRGSYRTTQPIDGETIIGVVEGPLGRDVAAVTQFMRAALSPLMFRLDPTIPPIPFREEIFNSKTPLRIGFYNYDGCCHCVPSVVRAINVAKETLEKMGHTLVPYTPYKVFDGMKDLFWPAVCGDGFESFANMLQKDDPTEAMAAPIRVNQYLYLVRWFMGKLGELTTNDHMKCENLKRKPQRAIKDWWNLIIASRDFRAEFINDWKKYGLDLVLCPVLACPAMTLGADRLILLHLTYTSIFNLVNFPAGVVPVTHVAKDDVVKTKDPRYFKPETDFEKLIAKDTDNSEDLPVGVQIAGLPFQEEMVLRVMSQLEQALKCK